MVKHGLRLGGGAVASIKTDLKIQFRGSCYSCLYLIMLCAIDHARSLSTHPNLSGVGGYKHS